MEEEFAERRLLREHARNSLNITTKHFNKDNKRPRHKVYSALSDIEGIANKVLPEKKTNSYKIHTRKTRNIPSVYDYSPGEKYNPDGNTLPNEINLALGTNDSDTNLLDDIDNDIIYHLAKLIRQSKSDKQKYLLAKEIQRIKYKGPENSPIPTDSEPVVNQLDYLLSPTLPSTNQASGTDTEISEYIGQTETPESVYNYTNITTLAPKQSDLGNSSHDIDVHNLIARLEKNETLHHKEKIFLKSILAHAIRTNRNFSDISSSVQYTEPVDRYSELEDNTERNAIHYETSTNYPDIPEYTFPEQTTARADSMVLNIGITEPYEEQTTLPSSLQYINGSHILPFFRSSEETTSQQNPTLLSTDTNNNNQEISTSQFVEDPMETPQSATDDTVNENMEMTEVIRNLPSTVDSTSTTILETFTDLDTTTNIPLLEDIFLSPDLYNTYDSIVDDITELYSTTELSSISEMDTSQNVYTITNVPTYSPTEVETTTPYATTDVTSVSQIYTSPNVYTTYDSPELNSIHVQHSIYPEMTIVDNIYTTDGAMDEAEIVPVTDYPTEVYGETEIIETLFPDGIPLDIVIGEEILPLNHGTDSKAGEVGMTDDTNTPDSSENQTNTSQPTSDNMLKYENDSLSNEEHQINKTNIDPVYKLPESAQLNTFAIPELYTKDGKAINPPSFFYIPILVPKTDTNNSELQYTLLPVKLNDAGSLEYSSYQPRSSSMYIHPDNTPLDRLDTITTEVVTTTTPALNIVDKYFNYLHNLKEGLLQIADDHLATGENANKTPLQLADDQFTTGEDTNKTFNHSTELSRKPKLWLGNVTEATVIMEDSSEDWINSGENEESLDHSLPVNVTTESTEDTNKTLSHTADNLVTDRIRTTTDTPQTVTTTMPELNIVEKYYNYVNKLNEVQTQTSNDHSATGVDTSRPATTSVLNLLDTNYNYLNDLYEVQSQSKVVSDKPGENIQNSDADWIYSEAKVNGTNLTYNSGGESGSNATYHNLYNSVSSDKQLLLEAIRAQQKANYPNIMLDLDPRIISNENNSPNNMATLHPRTPPSNSSAALDSTTESSNSNMDSTTTLSDSTDSESYVTGAQLEESNVDAILEPVILP